MDIMRINTTCLRAIPSVGFLILLCWVSTGNSAEAFLEPNQTLDIRAAFPVRIQAVPVREGGLVEEGTLLVSLDSRVLLAQEKQLQEAAVFHSQLNSAEAIVGMQERRLQMMEQLHKGGNARRQELEKVKTDLIVARARLLEAKEKKILAESELEVVRAQIAERQLRSPVNAQVFKIYKQVSELALATDPEPILTLVQLNPLLAVFHLPAAEATVLQVGDLVPLTVAGKEIMAELEFVSPVIEARSGTVAIRFRLENKKGTLKSGSRVTYKPSVKTGGLN